MHIHIVSLLFFNRLLKSSSLLLILIFSIITGLPAIHDPAQQQPPIKIGLLIPDSKSIAASQGAELAIRKANEKGGLNGTPFQLVVRSMEGPWGTGSKEAVSLIFEEKVWAILGSHDGRNAHLVEQACTKAGVVFVSAWASDPTLSQAFVPWFFNCVPTDIQQAEALFEEIYNARNFTRAAIISDNDYDSKQGLNSFLRYNRQAGKSEPLHFFFDNYSNELAKLADQVNQSDINCIILYCRPAVSSEIIRILLEKNIKRALFGPLFLPNENELSVKEMQVFDNLLLVPSGKWPGSKNIVFREEFEKTYNRMPGMVAVYSHDAMNLLIDAIRTAGENNREKIQKSISQINFEGITGTINFDKMGNRKGTFMISKLKNGYPVAFNDTNLLQGDFY